MFAIFLYKRPILCGPTSCTAVKRECTVEYILCSRETLSDFSSLTFLFVQNTHFNTQDYDTVLCDGMGELFQCRIWRQYFPILCGNFRGLISKCGPDILRIFTKLVQRVLEGHLKIILDSLLPHPFNSFFKIALHDISE